MKIIKTLLILTAAIVALSLVIAVILASLDQEGSETVESVSSEDANRSGCVEYVEILSAERWAEEPRSPGPPGFWPTIVSGCGVGPPAMERVRWSER